MLVAMNLPITSGDAALISSRACEGGGDGAVWIWPGTKCVRGFDSAGATIYFGRPLKPPQILKRNGPLDVQDIEQILKKDSHIAQMTWTPQALLGG